MSHAREAAAVLKPTYFKKSLALTPKIAYPLALKRAVFYQTPIGIKNYIIPLEYWKKIL